MKHRSQQKEMERPVLGRELRNIGLIGPGNNSSTEEDSTRPYLMLIN
jgi:hypothetical protein